MLDWQKTFADAFKWPTLRISGWKLLEHTQPADMRSTKQRLRRLSQGVKTYQLSDDLVWAATKLSAEIDPLILFEHAKQARMPFDCVLFTWRGQARLDAMRKTDLPHEEGRFPDSELPATAVISDGASKTCIDLCHETQGNKTTLLILPLLTIFDPEGPSPSPYPPQSDSFLSGRFHARDDLSRTTHWLLTSTVVDRHPESARAIENDPAIFSHLSGPVAAKGIEEGLTKLPDTCRKLMIGTGGSMRFFAALCYLLNQPKVVRYVQASQSEAVVGARPREVAPEHASMLTTFLPREQLVTNLMRIATHPRKAVGEHDVAGHFAHSHRLGDPACQHQWPADHTRRQVCSVCGALRWYRRPSKRGHGPTLHVQRARRLDYGGHDIANLIPKENPNAPQD